MKQDDEPELTLKRSNITARLWAFNSAVMPTSRRTTLGTLFTKRTKIFPGCRSPWIKLSCCNINPDMCEKLLPWIKTQLNAFGTKLNHAEVDLDLCIFWYWTEHALNSTNSLNSKWGWQGHQYLQASSLRGNCCQYRQAVSEFWSGGLNSHTWTLKVPLHKSATETNPKRASQ